MIKKILFYITILVILVSILFPIYWAIVCSLRSRAEIVGEAPLYPTHLFVQNYYHVLVTWGYYKYILNSIIVASGNTLLVLLVTLPAAYALTRFRTRSSRHISFWALTNRMAPPAAFLLPLFLLFKVFKLPGTYLGLILAYTVFNIPLSLWMLMAAIESVPRDIEEAAMLDGLSTIGIIGKITIPLARSGIVATALLVWLFAWNHYIFGMILAGPGTKLITNALGDFALTTVGIEWEYVATMAVGTIMPVLLMIVAIRKYLVSGFSFGKI